MNHKIRILIVTSIPSPYQVELFNSIANYGHFEIIVAYLYKKTVDRYWKEVLINHNSLFLNDQKEEYRKLGGLVNSIDLVIFNYYQHSQVIKLINLRFNSKKPWCFWGERPGYNQLSFLGSYYRRWKLYAVHKSNITIWGIGKWAVEEYKKEFGTKRCHFSFPYFSDLKRFDNTQNLILKDNKCKTFLFSGSLIYRKGIDLLASAFCQLADELSSVRLKIMGEGKMRSWLEKKLSKHSDKVEFLGFQSWENLPKFYHQADFLCVPSRYDGWGLVVPEGLAAGLPVIGTTRTGAALEFIKTNYNGWLVPAGSVNSLYYAMKQAAILSEEYLLLYSHNARDSIANHHLEDGIERFNYCIKETLNSFYDK